MPPFWGVLLWRQRQRRRDAEAPPGLGLSSEAAAAAAEAQAAAEVAAGSGAAAGECGGHGLTGRGWREGAREGKEAGGRRRGAGPVLAAAGHRALRARPLLASRAPGAGRRSPPACRGPPLPGSRRASPARAPAPRETRPPRGLVPSLRALCLHPAGPEGSVPCPGVAPLFFPAAVPDPGCLPGTPLPSF